MLSLWDAPVRSSALLLKPIVHKLTKWIQLDVGQGWVFFLLLQVLKYSFLKATVLSKFEPPSAKVLEPIWLVWN